MKAKQISEEHIDRIVTVYHEETEFVEHYSFGSYTLKEPPYIESFKLAGFILRGHNDETMILIDSTGKEHKYNGDREISVMLGLLNGNRATPNGEIVYTSKILKDKEWISGYKA